MFNSPKCAAVLSLLIEWSLASNRVLFHLARSKRMVGHPVLNLGASRVFTELSATSLRVQICQSDDAECPATAADILPCWNCSPSVMSRRFTKVVR